MRCLHVSALASFRRLLVAQLSVLQAQGMYAGITSVGASVGSETSNRLPFYRLARKTESYSKAFVFIIAVTEVGVLMVSAPVQILSLVLKKGELDQGID